MLKVTEAVAGLAARCLDDRAVLLILADAIQEAGAEEFAAEVRNGLADANTLERLAASDDEFFTAESAARAKLVADRAARAEAARLKQFRATAFGGCGVTGCHLSLVALKTRVTRKRPRGSGSKDELARRLADRLDELADRRWARAKKGQRRPTPKQAAELISLVRQAVETANGRCDARTLDVADVVRCAARADATRTHSVDGGRVTAGSYKYPWTTTAATATRMPDGTIRVRVSRDGRGAEVPAPARWWAELAAKGSDVLNG